MVLGQLDVGVCGQRAEQARVALLGQLPVGVRKPHTRAVRQAQFLANGPANVQELGALKLDFADLGEDEDVADTRGHCGGGACRPARSARQSVVHAVLSLPGQRAVEGARCRGFCVEATVARNVAFGNQAHADGGTVGPGSARLRAQVPKIGADAVGVS